MLVKKSIPLKQYLASVEVFYLILDMFNGRVRIVPNLDEYYKGYPNKREILFDGFDRLICLEHILNYASGGALEDVEDWKQVIVRMNGDLNQGPVLADITGTYAWNRFNIMLDKYYNKFEIKKCLLSHQAEENVELKQYHYIFPNEPGIVNVHENCYCYDIAGAHASALAEIFPEAAENIVKMHNERKKNPLNKAIMNYFVGMLCRKGYRKTYNWIVQRTTRKLFEAMDYCDGLLIYANTDGFIVKDPKRVLDIALPTLGEFKLEHHGTVYTYSDKNYSLTQYNDKMKGNLRLAVRDRVDLRQGKVVHYDILRKNNIPYVVNVVEEKLPCERKS